jgi:membrane-associated phospholipid phosphatase
MSIDAKRRYASAAFLTLLLLSLFWPSPIVSSNRLWFGRPLAIDELSFLGREAPSWDVVFWCLAGLLALAIVQSGGDSTRWRATVRSLRVRIPAGRWRFQCGAAGLGGAALAALTWILLDSPATALAEQIQSEQTRNFIRIMNRLGGGMNPPMIVIFFALCGVVYATPRWLRYAVAMAAAALSAGAIAHLLKFAVGRTRPELWLGPFHYAGGGANSFPSGHTVGAFAIGGVLLFASRNVPLRLAAVLLAAAIGLSRVMAFRHWLSDVVASACLGLLAAWMAAAMVQSVDAQPVGDIPAQPAVHDLVDQ